MTRRCYRDNASQTFPLPFPVDIIEDQSEADARHHRENEAAQRQKEDLIAQQGMNAATQRMAKYAFWSTILIAIGTGLLIATLYLTRQANKAALQAAKAAEEAVVVAYKIGQRQLRAYVGMDRGGVQLLAPEGKIAVSLVLRNFGQTPAYQSMAWFQVKILGENEVMEMTSPPAGTERSSSMLSPGQNHQMVIGRQITPNELDAIRTKKLAIFVRGQVTYLDAFKARRHTDLSFKMNGPEHSYVQDNPQTMGWGLRPTDYGNDAG